MLRNIIINIRGTIDSLKLAEEYCNKKNYTQALIHIEEALKIASGDEMIKAVYSLKEKIKDYKNEENKNNLSDENEGTGMSIPIKWDIATASSYLPHKTKDYNVQSAIDDDNSTAWVENGNNEDGIDEYIELYNDNLTRIDRICMTN